MQEWTLPAWAAIFDLRWLLYGANFPHDNTPTRFASCLGYLAATAEWAAPLGWLSLVSMSAEASPDISSETKLTTLEEAPPSGQWCGRRPAAEEVLAEEAEEATERAVGQASAPRARERERSRGRQSERAASSSPFCRSWAPPGA